MQTHFNNFVNEYNLIKYYLLESLLLDIHVVLNGYNDLEIVSWSFFHQSLIGVKKGFSFISARL